MKFTIEEIITGFMSMVSDLDASTATEDEITKEYGKHNRDRSIKLLCNIVDYGANIYITYREDGMTATDQYLRNLNVTSPYRYRMESSGSLNPNVFIDASFVGKNPCKLENDEAKHYINAILGMAINVIGFMYPQLEIDHRNMYGIVATVCALARFGFPVTPEFIADALGTNTVVAEAVLDKYNADDTNVHGLPWYL